MQGYGDPFGAVGIPVVAVMLLLLIRGRPRPHEAFALATIGVSLLMWFVLSQQSRYITSIAPPLAIFAAGLISWRMVGLLLRVVIAMQAIWTIWLFKFLDPFEQGSRFDSHLQVVTGKVPLEEYMRRVPFSAPSQAINQVVKDGKVALYDEVFGYFLDVPYFWANPGHSTIINYDRMASGEDMVRSLKDLGFTHLYVSRVFDKQEFLNQPMPEDQYKAFMDNWEVKWKALISDALVNGLLQPVEQFPQGVLFQLKP
jgi:hypothetical protein